MRIAILALAALLLTGCRVVFVPVPVDLPAARAALLTPTPEPTAAPVDEWAAFQDAYATMTADYALLKERIDAPRFADPDWRAETALIAGQWRADIAALQAFDQPDGARWVKAWPLLQDALVALDHAGAAIENATIQGNSALALPAATYLADGANLLTEMQQALGE